MTIKENKESIVLSKWASYQLLIKIFTYYIFKENTY